jgi:hypothetical protein
MLSLMDEVTLKLQPLISLQLSRTALAADMRTLQFGNTETRTSGGVVGEYALHIQCPWRLEGDTGVITGSCDLYEPYGKSEQPNAPFDWEKGGSLQEKVLRELLKGYDEKTKQIVNSTNLLIVETVQADSGGGFYLTLSGGYRLLVFPDGTSCEAWRLFKPTKERCKPTGKHFVVPRQG